MHELDPELGKGQWHWKKKEGGRYISYHFINSVKLGNFTFKAFTLKNFVFQN